MNNSRFSYRFGAVLIATLIWELIFWIGFFVLLVVFGYLGDLKLDEKLVFKYPSTLILLVLVLPIIWIYLFNIIQSNKLSKVIEPKVQMYILQPVSSFKSFLSFFFFRNAIVFLIISMAQPFYGTQKIGGTVESLELVIALDISNSMNTKDIDKTTSRLEISKRAMIQLINQMHGEKIGVSIFAGNAYVQLPLTSDYHAAKMFINEIETGMLSFQGTNISKALETSMGMFSETRTSKGIILVTDGENHEEDPTGIIEKIKEEGIQMCVLGIGTKAGGMIPYDPKRPEFGYKKSSLGVLIISKINDEFIESIAKKANGFSMITSDPFPDLYKLTKRLNKMERTEEVDLEFNVDQSRYRIPLFISILCWILFSLISTKYFSWLNEFKKEA